MYVSHSGLDKTHSQINIQLLNYCQKLIYLEFCQDPNSILNCVQCVKMHLEWKI